VVILKRLLAACAVVALFAQSCFADDIPKGLGHPNGITAPHWHDPACCNQKDCEPLPYSAVKMIDQGYHVRYRASLGLLVDVIVPWDKARPSQDGQNHGCASPVRFFCFYAAVSA
jgi:hypothetical protein